MSVSNPRSQHRPMRKVTTAQSTRFHGARLGFHSAALGLAALALAAGCNSAKSADQITSNAGSYVGDPGSAYFVDANFGGIASSMSITRQYYGRLVTIAAQNSAAVDGPRIVLHREFVIDPRAESAWNEDDYVLETNPVTGDQTLFIKADYSDTTLDIGESETGRARTLRLLTAADAGTRAIGDNGFVGAGTYTMVPRNAAIVVVFDDLVDPTTLNSQSVRILVGEPTIEPFQARMFFDQNHGDTVQIGGQQVFRPTRLIIDPAISEQETFSSSTPIAVNLQGLPPSLDSNLANVEVRFPTQPVLGQVQPILQNLSQSPLTSVNNGTFDIGSSNRELVRAFRSGGATVDTGDPGNGFLFDDTPPVIVGSQSGVITLPPTLIDADNLIFELPEVRFPTEVCRVDPRLGDIIAQEPFYAEVVADGANPLPTMGSTGIVNALRVRLIVTPDEFTGPDQYIASGLGPIAYRTAFDPAEDGSTDRAPCFILVTPGAPDSENPTTDISTEAEFAVRFNEAIDPGPMEEYEGVSLLRRDPTGPDAILPTDFVPGAITNDANLEVFTFRPSQELTHVFGNTESFFLQLATGEFGPRDLAGNEISDVPAVVEFTIEANRPTRETGGRVIRFNAVDEEFPFAVPTTPGGALDVIARNEWFGNVDYDTIRGRIRPRSVVRSQVVVSQDGDNVTVSQMFNGTGTSLPLNPLGARTQLLWRFRDLGLPLYGGLDVSQRLDMTALDLDVEAVYLSPLGATPVFESFPEFSMSLSHTLAVPDEVVTPQRILTDPLSGVGTAFDGNQLSLVEDSPRLVSERQRGYSINPGDRSVAADGTVLMPLPMNLDLPVEQWLTYTYRSTAIDARGGTNGAGVPSGRYTQLTGISPQVAFVDMMGVEFCEVAGGANPMYLPGEIRSAGLPLMIDVKCYPGSGTSTQNQFAHAWAHLTNGETSNQPAFRAYSAGGFNQAGSPISVDPDAVTVATGGFDPTSTPPGAALPGTDNVVYYGALDLVTRVSRMHSIFYPAYAATAGPDNAPTDIAGKPTFSNPGYSQPLVVPAEQPAGTAIEFQYRVARNVNAANDAAASTWALRMDPYGDFYANFPVNYLAPTEADTVDMIRGGASCFDGSFQYAVDSENTEVDFVNGSDLWTSNLDDISGVEGDWIQLRVSFINNIATGQFPEISAIALNWEQQ